MGSDAPTVPRVFIVDDHPAVRAGLALVLEQEGLEVCGHAGDSAETRALLPKARADIVLLDLTLGDEDGLDLLQTLSRSMPALPVIAYSMHEDVYHMERAFAVGARGYVTKREVAGALVEAIAAVLRGETWISAMAAKVMALELSRRATSASAEAELTAQERKVHDLLGAGLSTPEIGAQLCVSPRTVESYYGRIQLKLGLRNMRELRQHAIAGHRASRG